MTNAYLPERLRWAYANDPTAHALIELFLQERAPLVEVLLMGVEQLARENTELREREAAALRLVEKTIAATNRHVTQLRQVTQERMLCSDGD